MWNVPPRTIRIVAFRTSDDLAKSFRDVPSDCCVHYLMVVEPDRFNENQRLKLMLNED